MPRKSNKQALSYFDEHLQEIADTLYEGDERKAFRHAAFQILAPDVTLSDEQVIEMTAIDQSGDMEVDGWFVDEQSETVFLFQAMGGNSKAPESKVTKFWEAPNELLTRERVKNSTNQLVKDLSSELEARLAEDYSISMVFASKGGFSPSARSFASSKSFSERQLTSLSEDKMSCRCSFQLVDQSDVANALDEFRSGFSTNQTDVVLHVNGNWTYAVEQSGPQSIRATVPASELVKVFNENRYKLFLLNPRGPIANAKVNRNISKTLDTIEGRSQFHLLNNGICATCESFQLNKVAGSVSITNFQIVNGCQTTVTLSKRSEKELEQTHVDLKLVVADRAMAEKIAEASNSQTALRAKDYTSFEQQQLRLQSDFARLQPPWYYEIKQGYWRFVLGEKEKARFKTGKRKRHIEVQPMAQASLAFLGEPSVALDRVRYVFQGIRSAEDRKWYDKAFPVRVRAQQLILPWKCLQSVLKETASTRFANFHILWLIAETLRRHYKSTSNQYISTDLSVRLADSIDDWFPTRYRIADSACELAFNRAVFITSGEVQLEARDFFRGTGNYGGKTTSGLIWEACDHEIKAELSRNKDLNTQLPTIQ